MVTLEVINDAAENILKKSPNEVVRLRLLRDVLHSPTGSKEVMSLKNEVFYHPWVMQLVKEQQPDGCWGRFHSMNSKAKNLFPTSEIAIRRALALGLDKEHPILRNTIAYLQRVLAGETTWLDRVEKSEGWKVCVKTISAASLAEIDPHNPAILPTWKYWAEVAFRTFRNGTYDPELEGEAHRGLSGKGLNYLPSRYALTLLASNISDLPPGLDRCLSEWIWGDPSGIGYLGADLQHPKPFHIFQWMESCEIMAGFAAFRKISTTSLEWLWGQRGPDGLWDFGSNVSKTPYFPLSNDWRTRERRSIDHSTRVLALLCKLLGIGF